jgi:hypothetical protein
MTCDCLPRNAQLSDAFLVINQIEMYDAQDTQAVSRLASAIERFSGVCVLVLEANIGVFADSARRCATNTRHVPLRKPAPLAPAPAAHPAFQYSPRVHEQAHTQRCVEAAHSIRLASMLPFASCLYANSYPLALCQLPQFPPTSTSRLSVSSSWGLLVSLLLF